MKKRIGKRYELHNLIGSGGMGSVFRATDLLTGQQVALKRVLTAGPMPGSSGSEAVAPRLALAHEFQLLATLRHPNIISVLDYGFDERKRPYFTMDLLDDACPILQAGNQRPFMAQVNLLLQLLEALLYLHRRHILHRDLKPANVLVKGDAVKVLDFGLSGSIEDQDGTATIGTWAYMAPEVLQGQPASPASDLYAFGVIAYELLAGEAPFATINDVLNIRPNLVLLPPNDDLQELISRLLERDPAKRFARTSQVIRALCRATGHPLLPETAVIRESFLQAAGFVGRTAELKQLSRLLKEALHGRGSSWLIGGESGVGKSRLLDELQPRALVQGALVLRGQSMREGSAPYQLWLPAIRRLVLNTGVDPLEQALLKTILPDIERLLQQPAVAPPEIDPETTRTLLHTTITNLFYRQSDPIVLLLEDLHWARSESLALLAWLTQLNHDYPLFIVAAYRDDDAPYLPSELRSMQLLTLSRFDREETAALGEAMLGHVGSEPGLVEFLHQETEGNAFFLTEVVRALAEEAGRLSAISPAGLPAKIYPGGMRYLIERRLARVPEADRPLLRQAAVLGRRLDRSLLRVIAPDKSLDSWLVMGAEAAVFTIRDEHWRFAHDKLRDALLLNLSPVDERDLHRRAAWAIEEVYPDDPQQTSALAYHWRMAADKVQEARYTLAAGAQALESSAYQEAVRFLRRARRLPQPQSQLAELERMLGQAHHGLGAYDKAQTHLITALNHYEQANNRGGMAHCLHLLSQAAYALGAFGEAETTARRSLALSQESNNRLGQARAHHSLGLAAYATGRYQQAQQHYHQSLAHARAQESGWEIARALNGLGSIAFELGNYEEAEKMYRQSLEISQQIGNRNGIAKTYNNLGLLAERRQDYEMAWEYHQRSLQLKREFGQKRGISISLMNLGVVAFAREHYDDAEPLLRESLEICREIGDTWGVACCLSNLGDVQRVRHAYEAAQGLLYEAWLTSLSIQAAPLALSVLLSLAELYLDRGNAAGALLAASFVLAQPEIDTFGRERGQRTVTAAATALSAEESTAVVAQAKAHTMKTIAGLFT